MRRPLAFVAAVAAAALSGAILGEYDITGATPIIGGILFGIVVGEVVLVVAKGSDRMLAIAAGCATAAGLVLAIWDSSAHFRFVHAWSWAAVAVGPVAAYVWVVRGSARQVGGSPTEP